MARTYNVLWARTAEGDLETIIGFIAADGVEKAIAVLDGLQEKAAALNIMPDRGRIVPELKAQGILLYRELVAAPWRVIYRIAGNEVYVLAVLDSRRNMEDILLNRFLAK